METPTAVFLDSHCKTCSFMFCKQGPANTGNHFYCGKWFANAYIRTAKAICKMGLRRETLYSTPLHIQAYPVALFPTKTIYHQTQGSSYSCTTVLNMRRFFGLQLDVRNILWVSHNYQKLSFFGRF